MKQINKKDGDQKPGLPESGSNDDSSPNVKQTNQKDGVCCHNEDTSKGQNSPPDDQVCCHNEDTPKGQNSPPDDQVCCHHEEGQEPPTSPDLGDQTKRPPPQEVKNSDSKSDINVDNETDKKPTGQMKKEIKKKRRHSGYHICNITNERGIRGPRSLVMLQI